MQIVAKSSAENGKATLDPWTVVHFSSGLAIGLSSLSFPQMLAAITLGEIAKRLVREDLDLPKESISNKASDICAIAAGIYFGRRWQNNK